MLGYDLLTIGSWLSFFGVFWLLLLGQLPVTVGTIAALILFWLFGMLGANGAVYLKAQTKEKVDD